jgi:hypothetical protein
MLSSDICLDKCEELLRRAATAPDAAARAVWISQARKWLGSALMAAVEEAVEALPASRMCVELHPATSPSAPSGDAGGE